MVESYGERVRAAREEQKLSQAAFAALLGMPERTLQDIESGKVKRPQRKTRDRIDAVLGARAPGETEAEWPSDLDAFLKLLGAFLYALPEAERDAFIQAEIVRLARWNR